MGDVREGGGGREGGIERERRWSQLRCTVWKEGKRGKNKGRKNGGKINEVS